MEPVRKVLIILSTAEREKAIAGLMYAQNAQDNHWFDDVRVVLFGPSKDFLPRTKRYRRLVLKFSRLLLTRWPAIHLQKMPL